jgi:hypothetical protein
MKLGVWSYSFAASVAALATSLAGFIGGGIYPWHFGAKPLPVITDMLVHYSWTLLFVPLIWIGAAVWMTRRSPSPSAMFAFAGLATLFISGLLSVAGLALMAPFASFTDR